MPMNHLPDAVAEGRPVRRPTAVTPSRVIASVACFVVGFVLVQWAFDHIASPFQSAERKVGPKFAWFAAHKDAYDVVFVGSSRVLNQISPRRFDAEMAAAGHPCHSFNFGYVGMYLPECSFLVDQILALHPKKLRLVVLELSNPAPRHEEMQNISEREVYWHRPGPTLLACSALLTDTASPLTLAERRAQLLRQAGLFARSVCHVGGGPNWVRDVFARQRRLAKKDAREILGPDHDGFEPLGTFLGAGANGSTKSGGSENDLAGFLAGVNALRHGGADAPAAPALPPAAVEFGKRLLGHALAARIQTLRRARVMPVFFIGPGLTREQTFLDLHTTGTLPILLAFNNPDADADLYDARVRADRYHLNAAGADLLTRKLAAALVLREEQ